MQIKYLLAAIALGACSQMACAAGNSASSAQALESQLQQHLSEINAGLSKGESNTCTDSTCSKMASAPSAQGSSNSTVLTGWSGPFCGRGADMQSYAPACPGGYNYAGIGDVYYVNSTACQSDAAGDRPQIRVRALCISN